MKTFGIRQKRLFLILIVVSLVFIASIINVIIGDEIVFACEEIVAYTVKIDMGNNYLYIGDDGISTDSSVKLTQGKEVNFFEIKKLFIEKGGYISGKKFEDFYCQDQIFGWASSYVPNLEAFKNSDGIIVLSPRYTDELHTVIYYYDDSNIYKEITANVGMDISVDIPLKVGYNFTYWTYKNESNKKFEFVTMPDITDNYENNGTLEILAQWEEKNSEIVFNSNGGSACSNMSGVVYGSILSGMPKPTKDGYDFAGWFAESDLSGKNYGNGIKWDQDIEGITAPSITLYAKWTPTVYSITFNADGGSGVSNRNYTIEDAFDLPSSRQYGLSNGLYNRGWINLTNNNNVITRIEKGTTGNLVLKARWPETESVGTNQTRTITKVLSIMDFRDLPTNVDSVYTFSTDVEEVILRGTTSKEFKNLRFEIEKERETPIAITLWDFKFQAQDDYNAIYSKASNIAIAVRINGTSGMEMSGDCRLNLVCKGDSIIRGGKRLTYNIMYTGSPEHYCSGIVCHSINIQQEGTSTLKIYGGNGIDGNVNNPVGPGDIAAIAGRHGGSAVWASYVYINVSRLEVYGGNGGNGAQGKQGDAMTETAAQGNTGHQGGTGGSGRYAFNVARAIKIASWAQVYARGGDGGNGGKGGKGGTGGPGKNNAWGTGGKGGKGGTGGRGGTKGQGYDAKSGMATITGSFTQLVNGSNGTGGPGGDGGNGGQGGKSYSGVGKPGPTGDPGDPGKEGR